MPNIRDALKSEIYRVSNKAARSHVGPVHKTTVAHRKQLAELKKLVHQLRREIIVLKSVSASVASTSAIGAENQKLRFTAKGLKSLRSRLDLSAEEFGRLLAVGGQTIYNWENQKTTPRAKQLPAIAELRTIGKKEAKVRLSSMTATQ